MNELERYNQALEEWDFDSKSLEEFLKILSQRNALLKTKKPFRDFYPACPITSRNKAVIDAEKITDLEGIAFHIGLSHQGRLYPLVNNDTGTPNNEGVFFSLRQRDVVYFGDLKQEPFSMVYFLDSKKAEGVQMQTDYDKSVISRYDLEELDLSLDKPELRRQHAKLNDAWVHKNTTPFDITKKDCDWLIVPCPIEVEY